ncbi:MAG: YbjQ family protein [Planctomycetota bacterium]
MLIVTTNDVPGHRVTSALGLVRGTTVRSRHFGHTLTGWMKIFVGGEVHEYTKLVAEAREEAIDRMKADAFALGANAIVGFKFATSEVASSAAEVVAYGTAVTLVNEANDPPLDAGPDSPVH